MSSVSSSSEVRTRLRQPYDKIDTKVDFPLGRHPDLPEIWMMAQHPMQQGNGRTFYFIHDGTFESACKVYRLEVEELKIPQGPREEAIEMGEYIPLNVYVFDFLYFSYTASSSRVFRTITR